MSTNVMVPTEAELMWLVSVSAPPVEPVPVVAFDAGRLPDAVAPSVAAAGDTDRDGTQDAVFAGPDGAVLLLRSRGTGDWSADTVPVGLQSFAAVAVADVDGDGVADLVVGTSAVSGPGPPRLMWFRHHGGPEPAFGPESEVSASFAVAQGCLAAADVSGDGYPDVVAYGAAHGTFWFRNPGGDMTGPWAAFPLLDAGYMITAFVVLDVDGDSRLDVAFSRPSPELFDFLWALNTPGPVENGSVTWAVCVPAT